MNKPNKSRTPGNLGGAPGAAGGEVLSTTFTAQYSTNPPQMQYSNTQLSPASCRHLAEQATDPAQKARWLERAAAAELDAGAQLDAFLSHLHRGGTFVYLWRPHTTRWYEAHRRRPQAAADRDTYFSIHPSRYIPTTNTRGEARPAHLVRSQLESICAVNCVFAEVDAKDFIILTPDELSGRAALVRAEHPEWPERKIESEARENYTDGLLAAFLGHYKALALAHVESMDPAPSVVVDSGRGYHCYWLLADPFYTIKEPARQRAASLQAAWVNLMGGDPGAKDLARVLRLPGTVNTKQTPALPVRFVRCNLALVYTIDDLERCAEQAPKRTQPATPKPTRGDPAPITSDTIGHTRWALSHLAPWRCDDYAPGGGWIGVGMALHDGLGDIGLALWRDWSKGSSKYQDGICERKWETFTAGRGLGMGSLFQWAKDDTGQPLPWSHQDSTPDDPRAAEAVAGSLAGTPHQAKTPDEAPRLNICGVVLYYPDPDAPNRMKTKRLVCGNYRDCEYCAKVYAGELRDRIGRSLEAGPVFVARLTVKLGRALVRRLGKENTLRVPLDGDMVVLFNTCEGTEILPGSLPGLQTFFDLVRSVPAGKRMSGQLGQPDESDLVDAADEKTPAIRAGAAADKVMVKMISHDCPDKELAESIYQAAWERTKARVLAMDLTHVAGVEKALDVIQTEYKSLLRMAGYAVELQITREVTCHLSCILGWQERYALNDIGDPGGTGDATRT